jgi:Zn finger protein HypA/HybF involved in hydrogenase expression
MVRLTTEQFIEKAIVVFGDRYDYSLVNYYNTTIPIEILCRKHGAFMQRPDVHLQKEGCPQCGNEVVTYKRLNETVFKFIERANEIHGNKYDYSKVKYVDSKLKVVIICKEHGEFLQMPNAHLQKRGCPKCGKINMAVKTTSNTSDFVSKAQAVHGDLYDYSDVNYTHNRQKVAIICKKHGIFLQRPNRHLNGDGCPKCRTSKGELAIMRLLDKMGVFYEKEKKFPFCKKIRFLPYDFFLVDFNIIIEYQGLQHFKPWKLTQNMDAFRKRQETDVYKKQCAIDNGYVFKEYTYRQKMKFIYMDILNTINGCR